MEWKLIWPRTFIFAGKNYYEPLIDEAHVVIVHGGVEKTMQYVTDRHQSRSLPALEQSFVASYDICQYVKQSNKPPLGLVTTLHVLVRPWPDIWMYFLKLTAVFIKCSTVYHNIEIDNDNMLYISRIWTIENRHSGYKFLIPIPHNFEAAQCIRTYKVPYLPYIGYYNSIVFDRDSVFMSNHFQAWAASKGILLEPATVCHQQTNGQTKIVKKEVVTIMRAYELEGDQWVKKLAVIQFNLNNRYNSSRGSSLFHTLYVFTARFGLLQMLYPLNKIIAETDRDAHVTNNLKIAK